VCGIRRTPATGHEVTFLGAKAVRLVKVHPRFNILSRFSHCSKFDNHEKTPCVDVIEILIAVRSNLVNVRVKFRSRQECHRATD
jgi:hypothetical protein